MLRPIIALLTLLLLVAPASVGSIAAESDGLMNLLGTEKQIQQSKCRIAALIPPGIRDDVKMSRLPDQLPLLAKEKSATKADIIREAKVRCGASKYYCPDHAPYCFLCRGKYSCCSVKNVSRCC